MNGVLLAPEEAALDRQLSELLPQAAAGLQQLQQCHCSDRPLQIAHEKRLKEKLKAIWPVLDELQVAAEEQDTDEETRRVSQVLAGHKREYDRIVNGIPRAKHQLRQDYEQWVRQQQRAELLGSLDFGARMHKMQQEEDALYASEDVTTVLRRTRQIMAQNVEQNLANLDVLHASNSKLVHTRDELQGQKAVFKQGKGLLSVLNRQNMMSNYLVWIGFTCFMLAVAYIAFGRTPAFVKAPFYSLLNLSAAGKQHSNKDFEEVTTPGIMPVWSGSRAQQDGQQGRPGKLDVFEDAAYFDADENDMVQRQHGQVWQRGEAQWQGQQEAQPVLDGLQPHPGAEQPPVAEQHAQQDEQQQQQQQHAQQDEQQQQQQQQQQEQEAMPAELQQKQQQLQQPEPALAAEQQLQHHEQESAPAFEQQVPSAALAEQDTAEPSGSGKSVAAEDTITPVPQSDHVGLKQQEQHAPDHTGDAIGEHETAPGAEQPPQHAAPAISAGDAEDQNGTVLTAEQPQLADHADGHNNTPPASEQPQQRTAPAMPAGDEQDLAATTPTPATEQGPGHTESTQAQQCVQGQCGADGAAQPAAQAADDADISAAPNAAGIGAAPGKEPVGELDSVHSLPTNDSRAQPGSVTQETGTVERPVLEEHSLQRQKEQHVESQLQPEQHVEQQHGQKQDEHALDQQTQQVAHAAADVNQQVQPGDQQQLEHGHAHDAQQPLPPQPEQQQQEQQPEQDHERGLLHAPQAADPDSLEWQAAQQAEHDQAADVAELLEQQAQGLPMETDVLSSAAKRSEVQADVQSGSSAAAGMHEAPATPELSAEAPASSLPEEQQDRQPAQHAPSSSQQHDQPNLTHQAVDSHVSRADDAQQLLPPQPQGQQQEQHDQKEQQQQPEQQHDQKEQQQPGKEQEPKRLAPAVQPISTSQVFAGIAVVMALVAAAAAVYTGALSRLWGATNGYKPSRVLGQPVQAQQHSADDDAEENLLSGDEQEGRRRASKAKGRRTAAAPSTPTLQPQQQQDTDGEVLLSGDEQEGRRAPKAKARRAAAAPRTSTAEAQQQQQEEVPQQVEQQQPGEVPKPLRLRVRPPPPPTTPKAPAAARVTRARRTTSQVQAGFDAAAGPAQHDEGEVAQPSTSHKTASARRGSQRHASVPDTVPENEAEQVVSRKPRKGSRGTKAAR